MREAEEGRRRGMRIPSPRTYAAVAAAILAAFLVGLASGWRGTIQGHTLLEMVALILAVVVGLVALVRYRTVRDGTSLFLATGFLGTGLLDGWHLLISSSRFGIGFASTPAALSAWSWSVSRTYLACMMLLGWWFWRSQGGRREPIRERTVYAVTGLIAVVSFLVPVFLSLPPAYVPGFFWHRPGELVAGALFLAALVGHLHQRAWRDHLLERCLVLSLVLGALVQCLFMPHSAQPFDAMFGLAHVLKIGSYGCVLAGLLADVNELFIRSERNARELRTSEASLRELFANVMEGIYRTTREGRILAANPALLRMLGYDSEQELGSIDVHDLYIEPARRATWAEKIERDGIVRDFEILLKRRDGSHLIAIDNARTVLDENRQFLYFEGTLTDITERKEYESQLEHMARSDGLTQLSNRLLFEDRLKQALAQARRSGERFAVHCLDLDNFKGVNDTFGHGVGDELLAAVARRLSQIIREGDTLARLGGDEFAVLQRNAKDITAISVLARKFLECLIPAFHIDGLEIHVTTSVGIAVSIEGLGPEEIMTEADIALYKAKEAGRNTFQLHDEQLAREVREHAILHQDLHGALEREEFFLEYQPQVDLRDGRLIGVEALLRWRHPTLGLLYPDRFIMICERSGLMVPLGLWVLREACSQRQKWLDSGRNDFIMAVNVSAVQLRDPGFARDVVRVLEETGLPPDLLELELTESVLMRNTESLHEFLGMLQNRGVRFTIDDFGTGHSSLRYLTDFDAGKLKIAMDFVHGVGTGCDDDAIVDAVVSLGHKLGRRVIAEGVETPAQVAFLRSCGCDEAQGSHFGWPVSAEEFEALAYPFAQIPRRPTRTSITSRS
ncbi:MAG TPA: EAL domain-containing protein [Gemmatimonadota bacterium]|nr:EAL domain-containing protein [Gemmatimonadota bacterium]